MFSLWYIILGWKEYNKPFVKKDRPNLKPLDPPKKPDLIPQKTVPKGPDNEKSEAFKPVVPQPADVPKSSLPKDIPKVPETQKLPELPKGPPKISELPKVPDPLKISPPKISSNNKGFSKNSESPTESSKGVSKAPEFPKTGSMVPELPKTTPKNSNPSFPRTSESPKAQESPKGVSKAPEFPKPSSVVPELPKMNPKNSNPSTETKVPKRPDVAGNVIPPRKPEPVKSNFPSNENKDFSLPPFTSGTGSNPKYQSKGDELFGLNNNLQKPNLKPLADLKDLSYEKGELPADVFDDKKGPSSKTSKCLKESTISNPDSLDSSDKDEEEEEEEEDEEEEEEEEENEEEDN